MRLSGGGLRVAAALLGALLLAAVGVGHPFAQGSTNNTISTSTSAEITFNTPTTITNQVNLFSTELVGRLNGATVFDQTFAAAFADPSVQTALTSARAAITSAGGPGVVIAAPRLVSSSSMTTSASTSIFSLVGSADTVTLETLIGNTPPLPTTAFIGVRSSCSVAGLPSSTKPTCVSPGGTPFTVPGGTVNLNVDTHTVHTVNTNTTTTNSTTLTEVYEIDGTTAAVAPQGSCQPSSSLAALVSGANVVAYLPKGNWRSDDDWRSDKPGVAAVNVEGSSIANTLIPTGADVMNSCASNSVTGQTVCTANNNRVYFTLPPNLTAFSTPKTSAGRRVIEFSGGSCTNCGVAMDAVHNKAVIGLSIGGAPSFQFLDLGTTPSFESAFASRAGAISEGFLIDPNRNLLLSPSEGGIFEIVDVTNSSSPAFFENNTGLRGLDSAGEDCGTGIAMAPAEFSRPGTVFIADLTQATKTPGSPGTWAAPSRKQTLSESFPQRGTGSVAVAQGTHTGVMAGEFGRDTDKLTAIALPATSGSGTPAIRDWVTCVIGNGFKGGGFDPHTVTAYQSPNGAKDAIALIESRHATQLAVIDLTQMLNTTTVPRDAGGHACAAGTLPAALVAIISVPRQPREIDHEGDGDDEDRRQEKHGVGQGRD